VQEQKCIVEECCIERIWHKKLKMQKNKQRKSGVQEGSEVDRATKCIRIVMSLVSHC
jgi:hypothetical protein